jgi:hypothetical protein
MKFGVDIRVGVQKSLGGRLAYSTQEYSARIKLMSTRPVCTNTTPTISPDMASHKRRAISTWDSTIFRVKPSVLSEMRSACAHGIRGNRQYMDGECADP